MTSVSVDDIVRIERAIMSVIQPMTGRRATGFALVKATGSDIALPANSYAAPIITGASAEGQLDFGRLVKTASATAGADPPTPTTVTSDGVLVPIFSMLGGSAQNLEAGTKLRWDPPIDGIEAVSVIADPGLAGGADPTGPDAVRQVASLEGIAPGIAGSQAFRGSLSVFPAVVVSWESATPGGAGGRPRKGGGRTTYLHTFRLYVFVPRYEGDPMRRDEGKRVLSTLTGYLVDRAEVDGEVYAAPPTSPGPQGRFTNRDLSHHIYWLEIQVPHATKRIEVRSFPAWTGTREQLTTPTDDAHPDPADELPVVDQTHGMTPG